jgi:hypothetical protein
MLGFLMFFNKDFMKYYITTIGSTVYFPSEEFVESNENEATTIIAHEIIHVAQAEQYGKVLYSLMYLFPQCLSLLALGSIFAVFWLPMLWCLAFLIFLAPIPAPWRTKFEISGYTMSLFMISLDMVYKRYSVDRIKTELLVKSSRMDNIYFKGSDYWFMWPFGVKKVLEKKINDICDGVISDTDEVYDRVSRSYMNAVTAYES